MHRFCALMAVTGDLREIKYVYIWGGIIIFVVLVSFFVYSAFKRWMNDPGTSENQGFTLSDMRKLRDQGKMSPEEYEKTRANMVAAAKRITVQMPDPIPRRAARHADGEEKAQ